MKILLLNDNPVVNKLVTLSAQKTSDEVETVSGLEEISSHDYDLLIVDDSVYTDDLLHELEAKIKYKKSLFICAKDAKERDSFSSILKKPFLPTDLVELFMMLEKEIKKEADEMPVEELHAQENEIEELDDLDTLTDDLDLDDELILDDDEEDFGESVLDDEEAQKVKDLLDENEEDLSFDEEVQNDLESLELDEMGLNEEEFSLDESLDEEAPEQKPEAEEASAEEEDLMEAYDMALDLEDEADVDISEEESFDLEEEVKALEDEELQELETATVEELEEEIDEIVTDELNAKEGDLAVDLALDLEDEADVDISRDPVDDLEMPQEAEDASLEEEIQNAVENLTQEDLESELDEDTLLQIAKNEIDPLESLTSKDLKEALGEETEEETAEETDLLEPEETVESEEENKEQNSGVEALKKLLEALSDKDVAASMKGMKISINITLGDNS
ncbi:hypothetical protein [Sulfurimonas hydrogeniphila]|uniref:hypothetical protein n=1 Tax=Sulfurimonas hydrogeniphila TaxID=2509341 RepID=UPI00125E9FC0|nr:hypothetical protein [Sulfurimonas hydrogeniphila]